MDTAYYLTMGSFVVLVILAIISDRLYGDHE